MIRLFNYLKSLMLVEFLQGLWLTLTYMFKPKYNVNYPFETVSYTHLTLPTKRIV